jgi:SAM-dependent methyltransferase
MTRELKTCTAISDKTILEVGAGTGRDGYAMSQAKGKVFLLDYSQESLRLARSLGAGDIHLIRADALASPFKDETFDVVFHQGLLEHFSTPVTLLRENHRILRKGGLIIVDVPQTFHVYTLIKHTLIMLGFWFGGWERQFTIDSLGQLLGRMGFEPLHYYGDWSRPGIIYKIMRQALQAAGMKLPMYPEFFGTLTHRFYRFQERLVKKKLFLYTVLSIGISARKK